MYSAYQILYFLNKVYGSTERTEMTATPNPSFFAVIAGLKQTFICAVIE